MPAKRLLVVFGLLMAVAGCAQPAGQQMSASVPMYDNEGQDFGVAPTTAIRTSSFEAPTPLTIAGATTITTPQLQQMLAAAKPPVLIDVLGGDVTLSLPGAIWLRGGGLGTSIRDDLQPQLAAKLAMLTGNDKTRSIVVFCLSRTCWLSHNTAVRAVALGYTSVFWYRGGRNAWRAAGLPLLPVKATEL